MERNHEKGTVSLLFQTTGKEQEARPTLRISETVEAPDVNLTEGEVKPGMPDVES